MHKKLVRPSLLDDDFDDEISSFGKNSNRFLKSNNAKDKLQEEFNKDKHDQLSSNRSITPRSVDTDSNLGIDDNDENDDIENFKNHHNVSKNNDFKNGYKSEIKKSPSSSLSNDNFSNQNYYSTKPDIVKRSDNVSKSPRQTNYEGQPHKNPRIKKRDGIESQLDEENKTNKIPSVNSDENDDLFSDKKNSLSKTLKFSETEKISKILDTINKKPEDDFRLKKTKFAHDEEEEIQGNGYLRKTGNNNLKLFDDDDEIEENKYFRKSKKNKIHLQDDEVDNKIEDNKYLKKSRNNEMRLLEDNNDKTEDNKFSIKPRKSKKQIFDEEEDNKETNKYLKKSKSKLLDDEEIPENKYLKKSKDTRMKLLLDDDENEIDGETNNYANRLKSNKTKLLENEDIQENKYSRKARVDKLKSLDGSDETDIKKFKRKSELFEESEFIQRKSTKRISEDYNNLKTDYHKGSYNYENKFDSDENELIGSTRYIKNDSTSKRLKDFASYDSELNNSSKHFNLSQMNDSHNTNKSELKPKPRKSHLSKIELDDEHSISSKDNKKILNDDIKRRSIRFDDQTNEQSRNPSRESSPRKSILSRQSSNRSSPSPPTSICEEVVQDPVTLKLKNLQKRQEENKRENEAKHESLQNRIINDSINAVADSQHEKEYNTSPTSRVSKTRPVSAKYKNVPPRITTRINTKSIKCPQLTDEWSSTPNLYSGQESAMSDRSFTNSQSIRETAYLQWYLAKLSEKNSKNETNKTDENKKKIPNEEERKFIYQSWIEKKKQYFLELARKKKEEEKKNQESKVPIVKDTKLADMAFDIWKKKKEEEIKLEGKEKKKSQKEKELLLLKEQEMRKNKKSESVTEWEMKKAKEIHDKKMKMLKEEQIKKEEENKMKEKLYQAEKAYQDWEEKAEKKEKQYSDFEKNKIDLINNRRAWRPSSSSTIRARRT